MWCRSRLEARVIGYNRHQQASEARRSAKYIRTYHRLRWPSAYSLGQGNYSVPMVPGSEGSAGGSGVSPSSLRVLPRPRVS